ncbi:6911_t:CDS:2 [Ambispora leptoticha]|uniref:6911_t:CDS:1 n=1 Tax=Ambispora leptoticha TaxID=144679 RepID=A0A9N9CQ53_9GLOM|nr:6911_t:CDS:2 [Ambispora leptoticha]
MDLKDESSSRHLNLKKVNVDHSSSGDAPSTPNTFQLVTEEELIGRLIILGSVVASIGGLFYVFIRGTVGGTQMNVSFSIYGFLFFFSALLTFYYARKRDFGQHKRWAVRTFALAIGSALYRLYVFLLISDVKNSAMSEEQKKSLIITGWLFYFPNLLIAELIIWLLWGYGRQPRIISVIEKVENKLHHKNNSDDTQKFV